MIGIQADFKLKDDKIAEPVSGTGDIEDVIRQRQMVLDHVVRTVYEVSCRQCGGAFGSEGEAIAWKVHHRVLV
jgi:hypothetical protein